MFTTPNKLVGYAIFLECFLPSYPHETQKKPFFVFCFQQSEILLQNYRVKGLYVNHYENAELFKTFLNTCMIASVLLPDHVAHPLQEFPETTIACTIVLHMYHIFSR